MKNSQLKAFQALCDSIPSFTGNRIDKNMLLIEAEELKLCFFVNNVGEQLKNPRTNTFEVDSPALWYEETALTIKFTSLHCKDKIFVSNVNKIIHRLGEGIY